MNNSGKSVLVIKALEDGVSVLYNTSDENPNPTPERLDRGEVFIICTPSEGAGVRIRGNAEVYTPDYMVESESSLVIGGSHDNDK